MQLQMRRLFLMVAVIMFLFTMPYVLAEDENATRSVYLNCWWSDANEVFYHQSQPVMCYTSSVGDSLLTAERIKNYCRAGFTQGNSATGFSIKETSSPSGADILIDGVSRATAIGRGVSLYAYAAVLPINTTYMDVGVYNEKKLYYEKVCRQGKRAVCRKQYEQRSGMEESGCTRNRTCFGLYGPL